MDVVEAKNAQKVVAVGENIVLPYRRHSRTPPRCRIHVRALDSPLSPIYVVERWAQARQQWWESVMTGPLQSTGAPVDGAHVFPTSPPGEAKCRSIGVVSAPRWARIEQGTRSITGKSFFFFNEVNFLKSLWTPPVCSLASIQYITSVRPIRTANSTANRTGARPRRGGGSLSNGVEKRTCLRAPPS